MNGFRKEWSLLILLTVALSNTVFAAKSVARSAQNTPSKTKAIYVWPQAPVDKLQEECKNGDNNACRIAAQAFFNGDSVAVNHQYGEQLLQGACDKNDGEACNTLASMNLNGIHGVRDVFSALKYWEHACTLGLSEACGSYATFYRVNHSIFADYDSNKSDVMERRAARLEEEQLPQLEQACKNNDGAACFELFFKTKEMDSSTFLKKACDLKYTPACEYYVYEIGGEEGAVIKSRLFGMYNRQCSSGNPLSCLERCNHLPDGLTCWREACEHGYAEGCNQVAYQMLDDDREHLKSDVYDYYRRACSMNDRFACEALSWYYSEEAREFTNLAAKYRREALKGEYNDRSDVH